MSTSEPNPLRFLITGIVSAWDPVTRVLQIGEQSLWVPPNVSVAGIAVGVMVTAVGHADAGGRRRLTQLELLRRT